MTTLRSLDIPWPLVLVIIASGRIMTNVLASDEEPSNNIYPNNSSQNTTTNASALTQQQQFLFKAFGEPTFQVALKVQRYGSPIIIVLGLFGNIVSFLIMLMKQNRGKSTCIYLAALAMTDIGSLLSLAYLWFLTELKGSWSDAGCKLWVYIVLLMTAGSAFTLLDVTLDRWIAICFPFKAPSWCTVSRTKIVLMVTYTFVAIFYIPMALQSAVVDGPVCASFAAGTEVSQILSWVNLAVLPIIPFFIILIMNIMIIASVYKSNEFRVTATESAPSSFKCKGDHQKGNLDSNDSTQKETVRNPQEDVPTKDRSREKQLTVMLLLVSFTYLIIILPISIRVLVYAFINYFETTHTYGVYVLLYSSLNLVLFLNNAINFYLYCLSGSKFRADLRELFHCKRKAVEAFSSDYDSKTNVTTVSKDSESRY